MAPEQAQREPIDGRADVYSLGIVLYELLTDRTAFKGESMMAVALQHIHEQPPTLGELGIRLSPLTSKRSSRRSRKTRSAHPDGRRDAASPHQGAR